MAIVYPSSHSSVFGHRADGSRSRHARAAASPLLAAAHLVGLAGAIGFISLFAVFASASAAGPWLQAAVCGLFLAPLAVLVYFARQASALRSSRLEARREEDAPAQLVIDA
jgi:formate hydrogenlyase subunit 3/multisubunit Na+/H+ antiporter MnhD subunit